eukprot:975583-Rhodomonas_salina.1
MSLARHRWLPQPSAAVRISASGKARLHRIDLGVKKSGATHLQAVLQRVPKRRSALEYFGAGWCFGRVAKECLRSRTHGCRIAASYLLCSVTKRAMTSLASRYIALVQCQIKTGITSIADQERIGSEINRQVVAAQMLQSRTRKTQPQEQYVSKLLSTALLHGGVRRVLARQRYSIQHVAASALKSAAVCAVA